MCCRKCKVQQSEVQHETISIPEVPFSDSCFTVILFFPSLELLTSHHKVIPSLGTNIQRPAWDTDASVIYLSVPFVPKSCLWKEPANGLDPARNSQK